MISALLAAAGALLAATWALLWRLQVLTTRQVRPLAEILGSESGGGIGAGTASAPPRPGPHAISVIVTARDEAADIERTVRRILAQLHPRLELIVVDDRSTDATGAILDRIAAEPPAAAGPTLSVIHVRTLPEGWLGKCHACHLGAVRARGGWLLFADGDVEIEPSDLLARVEAHAERLGLDHVALIPDGRPMPLLQTALMLAFGRVFLLAGRAHEIDRDLPRGGIGIGAFNMVRRSAYDRVGGHSLLRLDPVDDLKLGRLLKESGARQRVYDGAGMVRCAWQRGALGVVRGLEKNLFAGLDYSLTRLAVTTLLALVLIVGPAVVGVIGTLLAGPGRPWLVAATWIPYVLQVATVVWSNQVHARQTGDSPLVLSLLTPVADVLLMAAAWNSAVRVLWRGGVRWRDTFYPLDALRRGLVPTGAGRRPRF